MKAIALFWILAVPAGAGTVAGIGAKTAAPAPINFAIHPLLLGSISDPQSPLSIAVLGHAEALQLLHVNSSEGLTPLVAVNYLLPLIRDSAAQSAEGRLHQIAASFLAPIVTKQPSGSTISELHALTRSIVAAQQSGHDWSAVQQYDGQRAATPLGLEGVSIEGHAKLAGRRLRRLGTGSFGAVYTHPRIEGVVVKALHPNGEYDHEDKNLLNADQDESVGRQLARANVGPRVLARTEDFGGPIILKERVYGNTVYDLTEKGRYGRAEHALVLAMIDRMAASRIMVDDMRPPNIMIGRTLLNPTRRAYLVDGGNRLRAIIKWGENRARRALRSQATVVDWWTKSDGTHEVIERPFIHVLEEGLEESGQATLWQRAKIRWRRFLMGPEPRRPETR